MNRLLFCAVLLLLALGHAWGQGRGKIAGTISDADTKEPLIGASILVAGTNTGSTTDVDGKFTILNVLPGKYSLIVSMLGYRKTEISGIQVNIDLTARVDAALQPSAVEMEAVLVEAKQPTIIRDRTESSSSLNSGDIEKAPVEGLRQILELNANVQRSSNGNLSIRGSGAYEVNFLIDGVSQSTSNTGIPGYAAGLGDKANNSWRYDYNPLGVQQIQIISGGFSAEYGNAQAGVVKVVSKEGSDRIRADLRVEYRPPGQYHYGDYIYSTNAFEWKKWGNLGNWSTNPGMDSASLVNTFQVPRDSVDIWRQLMWRQWVINHSPGDGNLLGAYDYRALAYRRFLFGVGGPLGSDANLLRFHLSGEYRIAPTRVPTVEREQVYQNYALTFTVQPVQMQKFKLSAMYQSYVGGVYSGSEDIRWAGRDAKSKYYLVTDAARQEYTTSQSLTWTNTISKSSFTEVQLTHQFENNIIVLLPVPQRATRWQDVLYKGSWYLFQGPWDENYSTIFSFTTFNQQDLRTHLYALTANYTNQLTATEQLKMGVQASSWDMHNSAVYSSFAANAFITRTGFAEYYHVYPWYIAAYIQNKFEYEGLVANAGLRYDAYNMGAHVPIDRFDPFYYAEGASAAGNPLTKRSSTYTRVSPRLGISFPIGEATAFRLQYGHFVSMPVFSQSYTRTNYNGWASYGNADLEPKKTINYEAGIQQSLGGTHRLDVVAYYNDRVTQIGTLRINKALTASTVNQYYTTYFNNGFGATRGVDVTFERVEPRTWNYRLTYSFSRTSIGSYGSTSIYSDDPTDPRNLPNAGYPPEFMDYADRTHTFRAYVSYSLGDGQGPSILGLRPFENFSVSMTYAAQTGTPFTYVAPYEPTYQAYVKGQVVNNRRFPLEAKSDMSILKSVTVNKVAILLGLRINNLFDNRWLTPIGGSSLQDWVERGFTIDRPAPGVTPDLQRDDYKFRYFQAFRNVPREIYFTLGVGF